jgi:N-acetylglucosamine-6-phosphate deacetylase
LIGIKGADKTILVTDSVHSEKRAGVVKKGGAYRFKNGLLAGSVLTTIGALKNVVTKCGVSILYGVKMLTANPTKLFGVGRRKGKIAVGMDADLVVFDKNFDVKTTIINGKVVYKKCVG